VDSPKVKVPSTFLNNPDPSAEPPKQNLDFPKTSSEAISEKSSKLSKPACFFNNTGVRLILKQHVVSLEDLASFSHEIKDTKNNIVK
jgi:hypothetical protein